MSQDDKSLASQAKAVGGRIGRLFGHGEQQASAPKSTLDLADIQGFILRGYRMPMVRHFLLRSEFPRQRANCSVGSSAATNRTRRRSPPPRIGKLASRPARRTIPTSLRVANRIIALT